MTGTAPLNEKVGFCRPFFGDFRKMTRIFTPSFLEKVGIVQTYVESIFECYITHISVGLLDSIFRAQISDFPKMLHIFTSSFPEKVGTVQTDVKSIFEC